MATLKAISTAVIAFGFALAACGDDEMRSDQLPKPFVSWSHVLLCGNDNYLTHEEDRWEASGCENGVPPLRSTNKASPGTYASVVALLRALPASDKTGEDCTAQGAVPHTFALNKEGNGREAWFQCAKGDVKVSNPDDLKEPYRSIARLILGSP
jgi:hypothetical protein